MQVYRWFCWLVPPVVEKGGWFIEWNQSPQKLFSKLEREREGRLEKLCKLFDRQRVKMKIMCCSRVARERESRKLSKIWLVSRAG